MRVLLRADRRRRSHVAAVTACVGMLAATAAAAPPDPAPAATAANGTACAAVVPWRELRFGASKFLLSANSTMTVERVPAGAAADELRSAPEGRPLRPDSPCLVRLEVANDLPFGRRERVTVWIDPEDGAALQFEKLSTGGSPYEKVGRYTRDGYFEWRTSPEDHQEEVLSPSHWTHRKSHFSSWGDDLPEGAVVTDPYALLYLLSAASVEPSSTHLVSYIFADDRLVELRFAISGTTETAVDFAEAWPGGGRDRRGMIQVSSVRVTTDPATAGDTVGGVDLGFMGMRDELTILVDAASGIPLQLEGETAHLGRIIVRLEKAVLREAPASREGS